MLTSPFSNGTIFENDVSQITESSDDMRLTLSFPKYDSQSLKINMSLKPLFSFITVLLTLRCPRNIATDNTFVHDLLIFLVPKRPAEENYPFSQLRRRHEIPENSNLLNSIKNTI